MPRPIRGHRADLARDRAYVRDIVRANDAGTREAADRTLGEVREAMNSKS